MSFHVLKDCPGSSRWREGCLRSRHDCQHGQASKPRLVEGPLKSHRMTLVMRWHCGRFPVWSIEVPVAVGWTAPWACMRCFCIISLAQEQHRRSSHQLMAVKTDGELLVWSPSLGSKSLALADRLVHPSEACLVRRLGEGHRRPEHPRESFPGANLADFLAAAHKSS